MAAMNRTPASTAFFALAACLILLSGCASSPGPAYHAADPSLFLHDEAFPASEDYAVESSNEVFGLDDAAKTYLDRELERLGDKESRLRVVDEIVQQAAGKLVYDSDANTTAAETFHNQTANCLSMSIMTYAAAEYLGYQVTFNEVHIPEYWERRGDNAQVSRHINLLLTPRTVLQPETMGLMSFSGALLVDYFAPGSSFRFGSHPISRARVLAMFYNNKGVDALLAGNHDRAYAYLRAAVLTDPSLGMTLNNLGLLYSTRGHLQWAEASYREAATRHPEDTVAAGGLARVLRELGRNDEAKTILARLENARKNNPYFHNVQGLVAYDAGNWEQAIRSFHHAIELQPELDQPYYGLAKTYYRMGEDDQAIHYLARAARHSRDEFRRQTYMNKIDALSALLETRGSHEKMR